jgi:hypothetical protein
MTGFGWASRKGVGPHDSRRIRARFHRFAAIVIPKGPSDIYVRVCTISEFWLCFLGETVSPVAVAPERVCFDSVLSSCRG